MMEALAAKDYYIASFLLIGIGTYVMIAAGNLVKKVIGMNIFQTGIFLFFIASAYVEGGTPPLLTSETPRQPGAPRAHPDRDRRRGGADRGRARDDRAHLRRLRDARRAHAQGGAQQ